MSLNKNRVYVPKGWGYEDWLVNTPLYCGKDLFLKKDKKLSLHYHKLKDETFFIQSGEVELSYYDDVYLDTIFKSWDDFYSDDVRIDKIILHPGDTFHIPVGRRHTLRGSLDSHIFEFSTQHFDSDSIRVLKGD